MLLNWNIQRREISWVCFWRKREYNYSPMSCGRLFQMCGPKCEKVWKLWVLRLKRWSSSMRVSDEERKGPLKTHKLAWTPMCKFIPHVISSCTTYQQSYERSQIFPSKLSSSGCSHTASFFTYEEHKGWLVTCWTLLPLMPDLFMTSLVQTVGHKMAAPKCRVSETVKNRFFNKHNQ